jgi:hypothetical protein
LYSYEILGINFYTESRDRFSVLMRNRNKEGSILYVKGSEDSLRDNLLLDFDEKGKYLRILDCF